MKSETQFSHLQKKIRTYKHYPEYDLILAPFNIKKKNLKNLKRGDVLLLGLDVLMLFFMEKNKMQKNKICATLKLEKHNNIVKVRIESLNTIDTHSENGKKWEKIYCSLAQVQCRKLEVGHTITLDTEVLTFVELFHSDLKVAEGKLISVDHEIAIEITEVKHND